MLSKQAIKHSTPLTVPYVNRVFRCRQDAHYQLHGAEHDDVSRLPEQKQWFHPQPVAVRSLTRHLSRTCALAILQTAGFSIQTFVIASLSCSAARLSVGDIAVPASHLH